MWNRILEGITGSAVEELKPWRILLMDGGILLALIVTASWLK